MEFRVQRTPRPKCQCSECGKNFPSVLDLEAHRKMDHHKNSIWDDAEETKFCDD